MLTRKKEEKEFKIYDNQRPKVLLLGNGIHRCFSHESWDDFLDNLKDSSFSLPAKNYSMPMPLKASLLTKNKLSEVLKKKINEIDPNTGKKELWDRMSSVEPKEIEVIDRLSEIGFDYILTTNYSYELEGALSHKSQIRRYQIEKMQRYCEVNHAQTQFLINTYNLIENNQIWHIHGEARKPDSIVVGQMNYGKLLQRYISRLVSNKEDEFRKNYNDKKPQRIGSWIDAFVLGDVYILGFGFGLSENDLWWLLEYKSTKEYAGKTIYIEPKKAKTQICAIDSSITCDKISAYKIENECKMELLKVYNVITDCDDIVFTDYQTFYDDAIRWMKDHIGNNI